MSTQLTRISRINDIILKNEKEIKLLNGFLHNPFSRGEFYKELIHSQRFSINNYKNTFNIVVWVLNILLWWILIFGFSNINRLALQVFIFIISSIISIYFGNTIRLIIFYSKRKKELQVLISENKRKLDRLEE